MVVANGISKLSNETASKQASKGLEPVWMKVEGTVKKNEPDMYATIEEDLSLLESGDQAKTKTGATELSKTVDELPRQAPGLSDAPPASRGSDRRRRRRRARAARRLREPPSARAAR